MNLRNVLFLGGRSKLASVQIRCVEVAKALGCDCRIHEPFAANIPDQYSAFVCVKSVLAPGELAQLAKRGTVIWDIIDSPPPQEHVSIYLASTTTTRELFASYGRCKVIPHYHCNLSGKPNPLPRTRRPAWIGSDYWKPHLEGFAFDSYDVKGMSRDDVIRAHRQIGIGLNFRNPRPPIFWKNHQKLRYRFHVAINSGIKLINCVGFGIPSVSDQEPAYHEIGADCTIFASLKKCAKWVRALQNDDELYLDLRKKCLRRAAHYHFDTVIEKYRKFLTAL